LPDHILPNHDGAISIIHSAKGLSIARNAGIRACDTEYFFPLDANDWLPDNALMTLYNKRAAKGFTYGSTMLFSQARGMGDQHLFDAKPYDFREVMKMVYFPNGALQRKADWETAGGYREDLPFLEDWDYWITSGEKGICGTAIPDVTYWYRQHGGVVMEKNKSPEWEEVKKLIQSYHKDIYKGVFPPMCCGNKTKSSTPYIPPTIEMLTAPGSDGMVLIEYVGGNTGKMPWYGPVTGVRYTVGGSQKRLYIDIRDALTGSKAQPGFLEVVDHGNPLFKKVDV
jgi:glycosyltransferase involved in cell wall biosynthesis